MAMRRNLPSDRFSYLYESEEEIPEPESLENDTMDNSQPIREPIERSTVRLEGHTRRPFWTSCPPFVTPKCSMRPFMWSRRPQDPVVIKCMKCDDSSQESKDTAESGSLTLREVRDALWSACADWFDLGIALHLPTKSLLQAMDHHTSKDRLTAMLIECQKVYPAWPKLVEALKSPGVNRPGIAAVIEDLYVKSDDLSSQDTEDAAGGDLYGYSTIRSCTWSSWFVQPSLKLDDTTGASALSRSNTDEDGDRLLLLRMKDAEFQASFLLFEKNARNMVPQMQRKDAEIQANTDEDADCLLVPQMLRDAEIKANTDEDGDRLLLFEKMGMKNARKMVPQMQRKDAEIKALLERFKNVRSQMGDLLVSMSGDQRIVVNVPKMSLNVNDPTEKLISQPFFLEKYRYKLCLQVSMDGIGGSLSVFVHIMKGDFDSILDWPFMHRIAIKVKNQQQENDVVHIVQPESTGIKKPEVNSNITFGSQNFPTYSELLTGEFVQDDSISIECKVLWN